MCVCVCVCEERANEEKEKNVKDWLDRKEEMKMLVNREEGRKKPLSFFSL